MIAPTPLRLLVAAALLMAGPVQAQQPPLSAIDWLSDSVRQPMPAAVALPRAAEPAVTGSARTEEISVAPLGAVSPDAAGLLPAQVSGLPRALWGPTAAADLAVLLRAARTDLIPALARLQMQLLLAEADPPFDSGPHGVLLLARLDKLLDLGALDQAEALIERAGPAASPEVFRRRFDIALLTGSEDRACAELQRNPTLSPTYPARIFCQARSGDWDTAVLTYGTARALGFLDPAQDALLAGFLDPALAEEAPPAHSGPVTPLDYRLLEAIGEPPATAALPRAFAVLDLRPSAGWKAQIEAAERLVRGGALDAARLHELYSERRPAASGGVWERAAAVQALDLALAGQDGARIGAALAAAWQAMAEAELEPALAAMAGPRLQAVARGLPPEGAALAFRLALLGPEYEAAALAHPPADAEEAFLLAVATGRPLPEPGRDPQVAAVARGLAATGAPARLAALISAGRLGEAILRAIDLVAQGAAGEPDSLADGLAALRALGLEDSARRAALEILVLDRRG